MLNSAAGQPASSAASSCTSSPRTCLPSGRGWTVMPSAPASSAMTANFFTLGMPRLRVLRTRAILFRLTESAVTASQFLQVAQDATRVQRAAFEMVANDQSQHRPRLAGDLRRAELAGGHRQRRRTGHAGRLAVAFGEHESALRIDAIAGRR